MKQALTEIVHAVRETLEVTAPGLTDRTRAAIAGAVARRLAPLAEDAERYRWLRARDVDSIETGGVFIGVTPANFVITGDDADQHVDAGRAVDVIVADLVIADIDSGGRL
jgi:hypothetical protein